MKKLLTIIIPAYNVSQYIEETLESLIKNRNVLDRLEVLAINDGSTDKTGAIIEKYSKLYPNCIKAIHKENGGHGSGLNVGFDQATGLYLKILDGDDWVLNDGLCRLINYIEEMESSKNFIDAIINPSETIYINDNNKHVPAMRLPCESKRVLSIEDMNRWGRRFTLDTLTIRSDIFKKNVKWKIDENISYDDIEYDVFPIPFIHNIVYLDDVIYQYRFGTANQSMSITNKQKGYWMLEKAIDTCVAYYREYEEQLNAGQKDMLIGLLIFQISCACNRLLSMEDTKKSKLDMLILIRKYKDLPIKNMNNIKMKLLFITNFKGYAFVSMLYRLKLRYT